ncbi:hypothetical protein FCM35_KLT17505 [Carex littledalei]|uniref:C2H2-type domain-containing protein n=1 Tax=Carex littledalei TaxID=544730 RepID=A0A833VWR3_9POAL|nr:hypothetical protein FCM35_KLT17505 [Carex littledalei]
MPHHRCSFCSRSFQTRQQLGGHQTSHRDEINMLRKEHGRFMMKRCYCRKKIRELKMVSLYPNPAFWWAYRTYGRKPKVIDFFQGAYKVGELVGHKAKKYYCKVFSREVDLTLKL